MCNIDYIIILSVIFQINYLILTKDNDFSIKWAIINATISILHLIWHVIIK